MRIEIKPEIIKRIADELDTGMVCFYHRTTGELESYPDENNNPGFDDELWADVMRKVSKKRDDYLEFEPMRSYESFKIMENFIAEIDDIPIHNHFIRVISRKRPFAHFKNELLNYPELREKWFLFKDEAYIEYVKEQIEVANFEEDEEEHQ